MPAVRIRPRAEIDLFEIWNYIADDSEARADAFIDKVHQRFVSLSGQPSMARARDELAVGLRSHPIGSYVIFYRAMDNGIEIVANFMVPETWKTPPPMKTEENPTYFQDHLQSLHPLPKKPSLCRKRSCSTKNTPKGGSCGARPAPVLSWVPGFSTGRDWSEYLTGFGFKPKSVRQEPASPLYRSRP